ncbi:2-oxoacid:acceptor oxidoreductase family protein [Neobacillus niacini]|uniref:2-oxoacid:acceptor oxidoreductase family protein n=1 Tax=Neobacillus niacini TaxID=86668 RepID=UPI0021CB82AA|nr:2-oxoacid:acceptor oxidoreductase family protein [Neobacillus niacini]MCM3766141.1 2-oxoacid:acceptor oxidoreductase family protein [Neobacillus niacini]
MKSIALFGLTGQGIETAGEILSKLIESLGYTHRNWRDFSTIIRGGNTSFEIYISDQYESDSPPRLETIDMAVVWTDEGVNRYLPRLKDHSMIFGPENVKDIPVAHQGKPPKLGFNVWALGIITGYLGISFEKVKVEIEHKFKKGKNTELFEAGYQLGLTVACENPLQDLSVENATISGNDALCLGAIAGDVRYYYGYPITPASEILENFSKWLPPLGGAVFQVEDEIAAIHAALGCSYAGKRTFVATSGPGLALMTEGLGYAAATEIPLVLVDNQRGGPSTGMPTKTEQSDLFHLMNAGHGEFARILLTPTSVLDCIVTIQEALNLSEYYQCPVIIALDLDLALRRISIPWAKIENAIRSIEIDRGPTILNETMTGTYKRYESVGGLPPQRTVPGVKGGAYVASGDEHDERGFMEPDFKQVRGSLHIRRLNKANSIHYKRPFSRVGNQEAPITIIGTGAMGELIENFVMENGAIYQGLLVRQLAPLPKQELQEALKHSKRVVVAEYNAKAQIRTILEAALTDKEVHSLLRFDGEHFTDQEFEQEIAAILDGFTSNLTN